MGPPEVVEGPVEYGKVIFSQKLTYAKTGVLSVDLDLNLPNPKVRLVAGTAMFGMVLGQPDPANPAQPLTIWCTLPDATHHKPVCIVPARGAYYWSD